jgi:hypothetical protein
MLRTDQPLLVFGGCYSNLEATRAVLAIARQLGFDPTHIICTGDVVAYCGDPQETVDLVRGSGIQVVMGNCEESLAADADDCGCGFEEGSACERISAHWYGFAKAHLDADARKWMGSLPRKIELEMCGRRLVAIHGGGRQINRFIFESTPIRIKEEEFMDLSCDGVVAGHCGLPFTQIIHGRLWHNSGAVGMPANDGTPRTWYSILRPIADEIVIEPRPLSYSAHEAAARMRARGLTDGYESALLTGLWPSMDVLPTHEQRRRGTPLTLHFVQWPMLFADSA